MRQSTSITNTGSSYPITAPSICLGNLVWVRQVWNRGHIHGLFHNRYLVIDDNSEFSNIYMSLFITKYEESLFPHHITNSITMKNINFL